MDRPPIRDGAVAFEDGTIVDVGPAAEVRRRRPWAAEHDLPDAVILPGLINAHVHLELSDFARIGGGSWNGPLADWLIEVIRRSPSSEDLQRVANAIASGIRQCLRFGVTAIGDISRQPGITRPILRNSPLRAVSFGEIQAMGARR